MSCIKVSWISNYVLNYVTKCLFILKLNLKILCNSIRFIKSQVCFYVNVYCYFKHIERSLLSSCFWHKDINCLIRVYLYHLFRNNLVTLSHACILYTYNQAYNTQSFRIVFRFVNFFFFNLLLHTFECCMLFLYIFYFLVEMRFQIV